MGLPCCRTPIPAPVGNKVTHRVCGECGKIWKVYRKHGVITTQQVEHQ